MRSGRGTVPETSAETFHPTAGVHDLLLARIERVTLGADVDVDVLAEGGTGLYHVPAATGRGDLGVVGMNTWLHVDISPMGSGERSVGGVLGVDKPQCPKQPVTALRSARPGAAARLAVRRLRHGFPGEREVAIARPVP